MASSYSTRLRLEKQGTGDNSGSWGTRLNTLFDLLDDAIAGMTTVNTTGGTSTLTTNNGSSDEARRAIIKVTGALVSNSTIEVPAQTKKYTVWNATSGSYTCTVKTSGGSGIAVTQGKVMDLFCDGTDVKSGITELQSPTISGATITTPTITVADNLLTIQDNGDATKQAQFQASGITAGQTRTYTLPDASGTLALLSDISSFAGGTITGDLTMSSSMVIEAEGAAVASASSCNIWATDGNTRHITGTTTIADFATAPQAGAWMKLVFDDAVTLTQSASLNVNGAGADVTTAAGDVAFVYADTTTQMDVFVIRKSGAPVSMSAITNSLGSDVALNNTSNYFTGPTVAQGTAGVWFASGTVTVYCAGTSSGGQAKLWDGTTVIASTAWAQVGNAETISISLSGYLSSPAGNIRISVKEAGSASSQIVFNSSGNSKDSTLSAIRIA